MTADRKDEAGILTRDASHWVTQLASGEATAADAAALMRWRRTSAAHEAAYVEAVRVWKNLETSGRMFVAGQGEPGRSPRPQRLSRRMVLGGGAALAASMAGYAIVHPPLGLWPSLNEWQADYSTAKGEQRHVTLADATIQMNTQTSIAIPAANGDTDYVKLIAGEASFKMPERSRRALTVMAGDGRVTTSLALFDVRNLGSVVRVTCANGQVQVEHGEKAVTLAAGSQITYDTHGFGPSRPIDASEATAWHDGFVVFRNAPLSEAIAELNRYRPGRVILMNDALKDATVSGRFRIERVDEILAWVEEVSGARARKLPGGVVLLS